MPKESVGTLKYEKIGVKLSRVMSIPMAGKVTPGKLMIQFESSR